RKTKELNRRTEQVCAANKAIFNVAMIGNAFHNLDQQYIHKNGVFDNSNRALIMDSPSYGMMKNIEFNVDELSFFLDQSGEIGPMVLMELMIFEWLYQNLRQAVNLRAEAYEDLHVAIQTGGILDIDFEYIKAHYKPQYAKL
ncbi:MAG TPA: hypothetical protein VND43_07275, partial [Burkholderiales bacterium]|nr:hypothetical protein [Burkholderiales bacterium]